jgi:hypothetical protein
MSTIACVKSIHPKTFLAGGQFYNGESYVSLHTFPNFHSTHLIIVKSASSINLQMEQYMLPPPTILERHGTAVQASN